MMKKQLQSGKSAQYRSSGNSLYPRVWSGDCCLFEPVFDCKNLKEGDIVFCEVQRGNRFYAHKILSIRWDHSTAASAHTEWRRVFTIGNNRNPPRENGWCFDEHMYGRLVEVLAPNS